MRKAPLVGLAAAVATGGLTLFSRSIARKAESAVPVDGEFLEVDGNRLHFTEDGDGPAIVMIHGLGGQLRNFAQSLVDDLARDHKVIRIDRPGSGYSVRAPGASASIWQQAATIAGFIRARGLERPMVVGHSLGGAVALALALDHPECVGHLALIAPLTQDQSDIPDVFKLLEIRSPIVRRLVAETIAVPMSVAAREKAMRAVFAPEAPPEDFPIAGGGMLGARPSNFYETSTDLIALENQLTALVARYGSLSLPVDILYGEGDNLLAPTLHGADAASQIPGARLELVPGGHMLPFTQPERTAQWLREIEARTREPARASA